MKQTIQKPSTRTGNHLWHNFQCNTRHGKPNYDNPKIKNKEKYKREPQCRFININM